VIEPGVIVAGDFRIDGVLGDGGMGVVYEATQLSLDRTVALKLIVSALSEDIGYRERFRREGRIQANLEHPHIIDVYAAGPSEYGLFLAMRLVRGPSLSGLIGTPELTVARTVRLLTQVASALDAAHDVGLIHRDIKPHNILIDTRRDHSYLADFGVTKARGTSGLTQIGVRVGTPAYMAPEQFRGQETTEQSDIYSFGAVVYECFVGTVPYPMPTEWSVINAHLSEPVPAVTAHRPELPPMIDDVIRRAMAKEPQDRYPSASDLMDDVARAVGTTPSVPATVLSPLETTISEDSAAGLAPRGAGETAVSPREETERTVDGGETPPETLLSPEPLTPPADPTRLASVGPASASETASQRAAAATVTPPPASPAATELAASGEIEELMAEAAAEPRVAATVTPATDRVPATPATVVPGRAVHPSEEIAPGPSRLPTRPAVRLRGATIAVAGGVLGIAAIGFFVGRSNAPVHSRTLATHRTVRSGDLSLSAPIAWHRQGTAPALPGLKLSSPLALVPANDPTSGGFVAGEAVRSWPSFLPPAFRRLVGKSALRRREIVRLGDLSAFRYARLSPRGFEGVVTLYTVPQPDTAWIVACYGRASAPIPANCDTIAASLKLAGAKPYPVGVSADYAGAVNTAIKKLNAARRQGLRRLASASTQKGQAAAAGAISRTYTLAVRRITRAAPTAFIRPAHERILAALRAVRSSYSRLAQAAQAGSRTRYGSARTLIRAREAALSRELARLRTLGFR
jgi:serine/threonine-protein kinase